MGMLPAQFFRRDKQRYCLIAPMNFSDPWNTGPEFSRRIFSSSNAKTCTEEAFSLIAKQHDS